MQTKTKKAKKTLAFTVKKVYNVQHKLNLVPSNNNSCGANTMNTQAQAITTPVFAKVITASSKAGSKLVQCVGVSDHAKLGYKIRFSGKPDATARVSTLISTKMHDDIRFINLAHIKTEIEAAVELEVHPDFADDNAQMAIAAFLSKHNATEVQAARDAYKAMLEQAA
jgi:hypothetical protein